MITTSSAFDECIKRSSRTFRARLLKGGVPIDCEIKKVVVQKGACADNFSPGTIFAPYISAEISNVDTYIENEEIQLQIGLLLDDGTVEYTNQGYFTVLKPKRNVHQISFDAVGRISSKLNALPDLPVEMTLSNLANAITDKTGVPIRTNGVTLDGVITVPLNGLTCRELLEVIVSVLGGFATEDGNGNIIICKHSTESPLPYNGDYTITPPSFNDYNYILSGIKVVSTSEYMDDEGNAVPEIAYTDGVPIVTLSNSYMTKELFAAFSRNVIGFSFKPGEIPLALGDPRIEPWDSISFTDIDGTTHIVPCLEVTHTFDGGLASSISAKGSSETENALVVKGPIQRQIERLSADLFTAKDAIVKRLKTEQVEALMAELGYATVTEITGKLADFGYVTAGEIATKYARLDMVNINQAWVEDLLVKGSILADDITGVTGNFTKYLTGVRILGDLIEANTIKADTLILQGEDGIYRRLNIDALGQAVVDSDPKYNEKLDGSVLVAESVTADKIKVTDLTAFGATIGGFHITDDSIYSGVKSTVDNTTRGIYMDNDGQFAFGDSSNFMKFFKDANDVYRLATHFMESTDEGIVFGDMTSGALEGNLLVRSDGEGVDIRNGDTVLASFEDDLIELGKKSKNATVSLCGEVARLKATPSEYGYDELLIESDYGITQQARKITSDAIYSGSTVQNWCKFSIKATDTSANTQIYSRFNGSNYNESSIRLGASPSESTVSMVADDIYLYGLLRINGERVDDFVVDKGIDGNWTYRKYADGTFDAWLRQAGPTLSSWTASGNMYYGDVITINTPFTVIANTGVVSIALNHQCMDSNVVVGTNSINFRPMRGATATITALVIYMTLHGRWK